MTDRAYDSLTIDGVTFDHGFNDLFEHYAHTHKGSKDAWQIFRRLHLSEASAAVWHACVWAVRFLGWKVIGSRDFFS